jgi:hypothetical protein
MLAYNSMQPEADVGTRFAGEYTNYVGTTSSERAAMKGAGPGAGDMGLTKAGEPWDTDLLGTP